MIAQRDLLVERVEAEEVEAVGDQGHEQAADDGPLDGALAAQDARAADDDPGQDGERQEAARRRLGAQHAGRVERPGQRGGGAAQGERRRSGPC